MQDTIFLEGLQAECLIGIYAWERRKKQKVLFDLEIPCSAADAAKKDDIRRTVDYKKTAKTLLRLAGKSRFRLLESLAEAAAREALRVSGAPWVRIRVHKPGAVRHSRDVGICVTRHASLPKSSLTPVYLSIGSNIRPEVHMRRALNLLDRTFGIVRRSRAYRCRAAGRTPQPDFLNLAVEIRTRLSAPTLRKRLRLCEASLGRRRNTDKFSPRTVDLDILFFGKRVLRARSGAIPHPGAANELYALLPMAELEPHFVHPVKKKTMIELIAEKIDKNSRFEESGL